MRQFLIKLRFLVSSTGLTHGGLAGRIPALVSEGSLLSHAGIILRIPPCGEPSFCRGRAGLERLQF